MLGQSADLVIEERVVSLLQRHLASSQAKRALGFAATPTLSTAPARRNLQRIARKVVLQNREQASTADADAAPAPLMPRRNVTTFN